MAGRIQLAINVDDLEESIGFYRKLFGAELGYAPARLCQLRGSPTRRSSPHPGWRTQGRAAAS